MKLNKSDSIGLFILEDKPYDLAATRRLSEAAQYNIIGPAASKEEALNLIKKHYRKISLGLIDLRIPESANNPALKSENGLEVALTLKKHKIPVVLLSTEVYPSILEIAVASRFSYLKKDDIEGEGGLIQALELTSLGYGVFSETSLLELNRLLNIKKQSVPFDERELTIFKLRLKGFSDKQIGTKLGYSASLIRKKLPMLLRKIGVSNWIEADRWYRDNEEALKNK